MNASKYGGVAAGLVCIAAGIYLLQTQASGEGGNWLETIAHGMGIYFIGKGIFVWLSLNTQVEIARLLRRDVPPVQASPRPDGPTDT